MFHIYIHFNSDFNKNYHIGKHKKTLDRKIKKKTVWALELLVTLL